MRSMPADRARSDPAPAPFLPRRPVVIGLLGGIAAGKSEAAARFAAHGLLHVDADAHARAVAAEPAVLQELGALLGPAVVGGGRLDRQAVADIVFRDAVARKKVEAILHPRIRARIVAELGAAKAAGRSVLLDAPLLLEGGLIDLCDHVAFVDAAPAVRAARAAARGWHAGELQRREAAQAPLAQKRARASDVLQNDGELAALHHQIDAMLDRLRT